LCRVISAYPLKQRDVFGANCWRFELEMSQVLTRARSREMRQLILSSRFVNFKGAAPPNKSALRQNNHVFSAKLRLFNCTQLVERIFTNCSSKSLRSKLKRDGAKLFFALFPQFAFIPLF